MKKTAIFVLLILLCMLAAGCTDAYKLEFPESEITVTEGQTFTPAVVVRPKNADYVLQSKNNAILIVSDKNVTAVSTGIATLIATAGKRSCELKVTVVASSPVDVNDPTFPDPAYITFSVINYASAQLEKPDFRTLTVTAGTDISESFPTLTGYKLTWFTDEAGTEPAPQKVMAKKGETTYYAVAVAEENHVLTDENGRVTGLTYRNLDHSELVFPSSYKGQLITGIADNAFFGDTTIKSITIPETYTYIGKFAFAGCTSLKKVTFKAGSVLTEIGAFAFGPTYTVPEKEEEEEEDDDEQMLDYLNNLLDSVGLSKLTQPTSSETEQEPEITVNEDYLTSLDLQLPASVKTIGSYAFYNCSAMRSSVPEGLETIGYGAFRGSKIAVADLKNVKTIEAYAFYECPELTEVFNTENVVSCGGYAFLGTPLYNEQIRKKGVAYAGTIAVGCYTGVEKVDLASTTTLIADYAFNDKKLEALTVNFPVGKKTLIGWQSFYVTEYSTDSGNYPVYSKNLFLAVGEGESESYRKDNPLYADRICESVWVSVKEDSAAVNFGLHRLLRLKNGEFVYDRFVVGTKDGESISPKEINLTQLTHGESIVRINIYAFESIENLETLRMPARVKEVCDRAVSDCQKLRVIDFTAATVIPELITGNSFQFSGLHKDCVVLVTEGNYNAFIAKWDARVTAKSKLRVRKSVKLYVNGSEQKTVQMDLPYTGALDFGIGISSWYLDSEYTLPAETVDLSVNALYAKTTY